jgi:hypothetical protein
VSDFAAAFAASVGGSEEVKRAAFLVAEYLKGGLPGVSPNVSDLGGLFCGLLLLSTAIYRLSTVC